MAIGFDTFNFVVRGAFRGPDLETLKKCCEPGGNLIFLKDRDQLVEVPIKFLIGIYSFFTNKTLTYPIAGQETEWKKENVPLIRQSFDDKLIQDSKVFLRLKAEEPKPSKKVKAPEPEKSDPSTQDKETSKMATKKAAKKATKKAAKKAPAKKATNGEAKRGRKGPYEMTAKITPLVKENPLHATFNGKPGERHAALEVVLKKPGITVEEFLKKSTLHHLTGLAGKRNAKALVKVAGK